MEVRQSLNSTKGLKHFPLTPFRIFRGLICFLVFLSTAFMFLVYFVPPAAVFLRLFSVHYSRKSVCFLFGLWLGLWPFLFEKINKTRVIFCGDRVPAKERVLLIANHRTEVDWMYLWDLALRKGCLGYIKYVLKSSLMKLPIFGWGFHILEFIPVERKWEFDKSVMHQMLSTYSNRQDPLWLAVFPEGTDYTEQKCQKCQKHAVKNGLPVLNNVLLPKTRGFYACLEILRDSLDAASTMKCMYIKKPVGFSVSKVDNLKAVPNIHFLKYSMAVYDVTIAYKNQCPTFLDNLFGVDPSEVHMHVRRIPIKKIPGSENEAADWLMNTFLYKDQLLSDFIATGQFPRQGTEEELSTIKCLVNCGVVIALTGLFVFLTIYSSLWFKVYIGLTCIYLASATYFDFRPSPVLGTIKQMLLRKYL